MKRSAWFIIVFLVYGKVLLCQKTTALNLPKYDADPMHFGFTLAVNAMDFTIHNTGNFYQFDTVYSIENVPKAGFNLGMVSNFRLFEYLDFRFLPGLDFGQRNLTYVLRRDTILTQHIMKMESIFLDFPVIFKYKAERMNNIRPYLIGGGSIRYDLASQKRIKDSEKPKIRLMPFDVYYEVGFGIDYYLPYFKFSTELKFAVGVLNIVNYDPSEYTQAIERMNSKMIILSFHFE